MIENMHAINDAITNTTSQNALHFKWVSCTLPSGGSVEIKFHPPASKDGAMVGHDSGAPVGGGDVVLGVVKMLMTSHELDFPCVGIGAAIIDLEGAASEGAALMPAPPGVAVGIGGADAADDSSGVGATSPEEFVDNGPCVVKPALPGVSIGGRRVGIGGIDGIGAAAAGYPAGVDLMGGAASIELGLLHRCLHLPLVVPMRLTWAAVVRWAGTSTALPRRQLCQI